MKNVIIKYLITSVSVLGGFNSGNLSNESQINEVHFNLNKEDELAQYTDVEDGELSIKVSQNATTELTQFYSFNFTTVDSLFTTVRPEYKGIAIAIKDASYTGNINDYPSVTSNKPVFNAEIYSIDGSTINQHVAIIPSTASYSDRFDFKITSIRANCLINPNDITTIMIPDSVEHIESNSFTGIASTTTIECVSDAAKIGWEDGWNGAATVSYSQEDKNLNIAANKRNFSSPTTSNNGCKFFIGYYKQTNLKPLKVMYDVEKNGVIETRIDEFSKHSINSDYDAVGNPLGQDSVDLSITLHLNEGETVKDDSLYICNIYKAKVENVDGVNKNVPDFDTPLKLKVNNKAERFYLSSFITMKPTALSTMGDYTELEISVDTVPGIYEKVKPNIYKDYKDQIANGTCKIRYRFTSLFGSSYRITYMVGSETKVAVLKIDSPYGFYNLEKDTNNRVGFLIKNSDVAPDFDPENLVKIDLMDFYVTVDLYNYDTKNVVNAQCAYNVKFGISNLYNKNINDISSHNLDLALTLVIILSVSLYAAVAVGLFFLFKNLFKNDEFRRLNPKSFIKKALVYFVGFAFIVASLTTIIFRWGFLNNSIVVYNPVDAFVIIFTIGGLISFGLFIKELVVAIRVSAKRKSDKKLKIGELAEEDGTN